MKTILLTLMAFVALGSAAAEARCSKDLKLRTVSEVIEDLQLALDARDWEAVACNYAPDAFVIGDQGTSVGREEIVARYQGLYEVFVVNPQTVRLDVFRDTARRLFGWDGGWIVVDGGIDTFVVYRGMITRHTAHNLIQFTGPPPDAG